MKTSQRANIGAALLIGTNILEPGHYGLGLPALISPTKDVVDYELIAALNGISAQTLVNEEATKARSLSLIAKAAKSLKAGDFFLLTYSGFGGVISNFGSRAKHQTSATLCMFDCQLLLSEVLEALSAFLEGVNILLIFDCSNFSNGITSQASQQFPMPVRERALPIEVCETVYLKNKDFYDSIYLGSNHSPEIVANLIWISASQLNQMAYETDYNGSLTAAIKHLWKGGTFSGGYENFFNKVLLSLPSVQSPQLKTYGEGVKDFMLKRPFTI